MFTAVLLSLFLQVVTGRLVVLVHQSFLILDCIVLHESLYIHNSKFAVLIQWAQLG